MNRQTFEQAAKVTGYPVEKLLAWEMGESHPTLRQAERLAKKYNRPFTVFLLPEPPRVKPLAAEAEYRRLPGVRPGNQTPDLRVAIREMIQRRQAALGLLAELGETPQELGLSARLSEPLRPGAHQPALRQEEQRQHRHRRRRREARGASRPPTCATTSGCPPRISSSTSCSTSRRC
jgi:hypothetical protein